MAEIRRTFIPSVAVATLLACTNSTAAREDERRISGHYLLRTVDGNPLPASVVPQQECSRTAGAGELILLPTGVDVSATYSWLVGITLGCTSPPAGVSEQERDRGFWDYGSPALEFRSNEEAGIYHPILNEPAGLPPEITISHQGNSYRFVLVQHRDAPQGVVYVKFVDQSGQPIERVVIDAEFPNGLRGGGTTNASGEIGMNGVVGTWTIGFVPPDGYQVPTSQPNPFSVTVAKDEVRHVQVTITKT